MNTILRYISLVVLALAFVVASAVPAAATTITVQSIVIPNYRVALNPGETLYLVIYADRPFISSAGIPIQAGSPANGRWYKRVTCTVVGTDVTIPAFTLDSTTDAQDIPGKAARYSAYFYANTRNLGQYGGFESFRLLPVYTNPTPTDATWAQIRADNTAGAVMSIDRTTLTSEQINRLIDDLIATAGGVTTIEGQAGPTVTITDDTNVTITGSGNVLTVGWAGTLAVARGGSGSGTASGARTNLGAAASGANSDITSLSALSTPLSGAQGGTGFGSYTVGDLLYASGASTLSKLAGVATGQVLVSGGVATAPAWSASPTLTSITSTNLTVTSLTTGRVPYVGAANQILDDSNFLWDATNDRLSIGTTRSDYSLNIPALAYLGGVNNAGSGSIRLIGTTRNAVDGLDAVSIGTSASRITLDAPSYSVLANPPTTTDTTTAGSFGKVFYDGAVTPVGAAFAVKATWDSSYGPGAGGNLDTIHAVSTNDSTRNAVALKGTAFVTRNTGFAFGGNLIAGTSTTGANGSTAYALELNAVNLETGTGNALYPLYIANVGDADTVDGSFKDYIKMGISVGDASSGAVHGLEFDSSIAPAIISGSTVSGSALIRVNGAITPTYGLDLADLDAQSDAGILLHNGDGFRSNTTGLVNVNIAALSTGNYIELGDGTYSASGALGVVIRDGGAAAMKFDRSGTQDIAGNIGFNQVTSTAAQLHVTSVVKRNLTGSAYSITNGSPNLTVTGGAFLTEVAPGSSIEISAQAGTYYTVLSVTDNDNLVLTANYTGSTTTTSTGKSDYAPLLIESGSGDDWIAFNNYHSLVVRGNSTFGDERGMLQLAARQDANEKLLFGRDNAANYSYISSIESGVGWTPLVLQGGAAQGNTGGVVIGTSTVSGVGAMLKVEGSGAKTGNHVGSEFNNSSTSVASFQKIGAQYLSGGSWIGPNVAGYFAAVGAVDTTSSGTANRWNVPVGAYGGSLIVAPHSTQVTVPVAPSDVPTATVDVLGFPAENATDNDTGDEYAITNGTVNVSGNNTEWNTPGNDDYIRPGDAVMFGSEGTVAYEVSAVNSNTSLTLSGATAGTNGATEMYQDPILLRLRNGFGTERLRVESSGFTKLTGQLVLTKGTDVASVAGAITLPAQGNIFTITGVDAITSITTNSTEAGKIVILIFDSTATLVDGSNLILSAAGGGSANDTITLVSNGTNWYEIGRSAN